MNLNPMKMIDNTEQPNRQYFNDAQYYSLAMNTRDEVIVAGRGIGKGAIQARRLQSCFQGMPGSMGGFVAPSVKRCLTNILRGQTSVEKTALEVAHLHSCQLGEHHQLLQRLCLQHYLAGPLGHV